MPLIVAQSVHPRYHAVLTRTTNHFAHTHLVYVYVYVEEATLLSVACGRRMEFAAADKLCIPVQLGCDH